LFQNKVLSSVYQKIKAMTLLQKLLFENSYNSENISNIMSIANQCADYVKDNNDFVENVYVENDGKINFSFTEAGLRGEDAATLFDKANDAFLDEFNDRARMELSGLF
jgi:hypothetical protein